MYVPFIEEHNVFNMLNNQMTISSDVMKLQGKLLPYIFSLYLCMCIFMLVQMQRKLIVTTSRSMHISPASPTFIALFIDGDILSPTFSQGSDILINWSQKKP